jgi:fructose-1,6-bisphosphatase/inositol monophosphatase family enzyme
MPDPDVLRRRLCALQDEVLAALLASRAAGVTGTTEVVGANAADVSYGLDRIADVVLVPWFEANWPADEPVLVVSEGLDEPVAVGRGEPRWTCIVDTVDGTRELMFDKRAAWTLAAVAPAGGSLADVVAAAMTGLPTVTQWASDRYSAVRGRGRRGIVGERVDVRTRGGARTRLVPEPSTATDLRHGFSSFARFLPAGKELLARFETRVWEELYGAPELADLPIFEDQYMATGGQFHELLTGRDRVLGDLRPLALRALGLPTRLVCHPYDCCTALILEEAGCVVVGADGAPLDVPLDTTSPVTWIGVANRPLADRVLPAVFAAISECFPPG